MEPRQKYQDTEMWEVENKDIVQLKYDGIWCLAHVHNGVIDYWSRHGKIKKSEPNTFKVCDGKYIGELMFGSEWSQDPQLKGRFFVFDQIEELNKDTRQHPYVNRYQRMCSTRPDINPMWSIVKNYHFAESKLLWDCKVVRDGYEGLVFRSSQGTWDETIFRQKATFTVDLQIEGFEEGEGRLKGTLGAILASRMGENRSQDAPLIRIGGGLSDALRSEIWRNQSIFSARILSVECKRIFDSGKLRHPNFVCFHPDKNDEDFINQYGQLK